MKKINVFVILFLMCVSAYRAQTNANHPTIASVAIGYRAVTQNASSGAQSIPNMTVMLQPSVSVSKIYYKITDSITDSTLFQVSYPVNASAVISNGQVLFQNNNGFILLSPGQLLPAITSKYKLWTEDSQNNLSPVYSLTR